MEEKKNDWKTMCVLGLCSGNKSIPLQLGEAPNRAHSEQKNDSCKKCSSVVEHYLALRGPRISPECHTKRKILGALLYPLLLIGHRVCGQSSVFYKKSLL